MSEAQEWNLEPDGNVRLPEIRGWRTAGMGVGIGLQLRTGPRPGGLKEQLEYFQVALSSDQARRLAQALVDAADKTDARLKGKA